MAHILVVDDEESIRFSFHRFLSSEKHSVITADGLQMALAYMSEKNFDVILADIILPDGWGIDLLQQVLRKNIKTRVIIMTAYPTIETIEASFNMHASDYLVKPLRQVELLRSINKAINSQELFT